MRARLDSRGLFRLRRARGVPHYFPGLFAFIALLLGLLDSDSGVCYSQLGAWWLVPLAPRSV